jgi:hypothetical protein
MPPAEAVGTECQSRLDEDAAHQEQPAADADDRAEPASVFQAQEPTVLQPQVAAALPVLAVPDDAAPPEAQAVLMQQPAQAPLFSAELRLQRAQLLRAQVLFLPQAAQRDDVK